MPMGLTGPADGCWLSQIKPALPSYNSPLAFYKAGMAALWIRESTCLCRTASVAQEMSYDLYLEFLTSLEVFPPQTGSTSDSAVRIVLKLYI